VGSPPSLCEQKVLEANEASVLWDGVQYPIIQVGYWSIVCIIVYDHWNPSVIAIMGDEAFIDRLGRVIECSTEILWAALQKTNIRTSHIMLQRLRTYSSLCTKGMPLY
jgi:hypothetical protein